MKKLAVLAALAISAVIFNPVEASAVSVDNTEITEMSHWTQFRDSITGKRSREKARERERYDNYYYGGRDYRDSGRYDRGRDHIPPPPPPHHRRW